MSSTLSFSVIVNTTDRADPLQTLLHSLERQSYPNFEVIVVVGPTRDHTMDILAPYEDRVRIEHCAYARLGQSRNIGIRAAQGDIVVFIDDDAVPCHHWLEQLAYLYKDPTLAGTGGIVYLVHPNHPTIQHKVGNVSSLAEQQDVYDSHLKSLVPFGNGYLWSGRMMGTNMSFRRSALLDVGGFDEFYQWVYDDTDLALRLARAGYWLHPVHEAPVYHVPASSRNRTGYTDTGRWWIALKAATYFGIKNGRSVGDPWRAIIKQCRDYRRGLWMMNSRTWDAQGLPSRHRLRMRYEEIRGLLMGGSAGLCRPRQLLDRSATKIAQSAGEPKITTIRRFQNQDSLMQPTVDPISGSRANVVSTKPPLHICLLNEADPSSEIGEIGRETALLARGLFELGHQVHIIAQGDCEQIFFQEGAYIHQIPNKLNRYDHLCNLPTLYYNLNYSHAVYEKIKRLIFNDGVQIVDSAAWQLDGLVTAKSASLPVIMRRARGERPNMQAQNGSDMEWQLVVDLTNALFDSAVYTVPDSLVIDEHTYMQVARTMEKAYREVLEDTQ